MTDWEIIGAAIRTIRDRFVTVVGLAAAVLLPSGLMASGQHAFGGVRWVSTTVTEFLSNAVVAAAITFVVCQARLRRGTTIRDGLRIVLARVGGVLATVAVIVAGAAIWFMAAWLVASRVADAIGGEPSLKLLATELLFGLSAVALVYPGALFGLAYQVVVLERRSGMGATRRSATLVRGDAWRVVMVFGAASLLAGALGWVADLASWVLPSFVPLGRYAVEVVRSVLVSTALTLLYVDLRGRKEALDVVQLEDMLRPLAAQG